MTNIPVYWSYMPRVSRKNVSKSIHGELDENFAFLISSLSQATEIKQFFQDFLTDEEKTMLTDRKSTRLNSSHRL